MKQICATVVLLAVLAGSSLAQVPRAQIEKLFSPHKKARIALHVRDLQSGDTLYARSAERLQKPASVLKLFVTAAALERFGPEFSLQTDVYLDGADLLVVGGGDPGFGDERLAQKAGHAHLGEFDEWVAALRARGLTRIDKIAVDDSIFERDFRHPDWPTDQAANWYQAPIGGLNLNDNCLDVRVVGGGGRAKAETTPRVTEALLRSKLTAAKKNKPIAVRALGQDVIEVRGPVSKSSTVGPVAVGVPALFVGSAIEAELEARGVSVDGTLVRRQLSDAHGAVQIASHRTSLPDLLWRTNTFSQNMFAEALLKSLSAYRSDGARSGTPGSWETGRSILTRELAEMGVDVRGAVFRDGSGLSHSNRASARQITDLLRVMWTHRHAEVFRASLARPFSPGTMERRYRASSLRDRVWGKTGTIAGTRTLAGYIETARGPIAFALLIEGQVPGDLPAKVCEALVETR